MLGLVFFRGPCAILDFLFLQMELELWQCWRWTCTASSTDVEIAKRFVLEIVMVLPCMGWRKLLIGLSIT